MNLHNIRQTIYRIIFEADTFWGKFFDISLIIAIICSVVAVMLDSVRHINAKYGEILYAIEWFFTLLFSIEYILRIYLIKNPRHYILSFYGIVDLLAVLPSYLSLIFTGTHYLIVIRILRVLRIFRVLKIVQYIGEANVLIYALKKSRRKITIFLFSVMTLVIILGSLMYLIESSNQSGFSSIPQSVYWAIVTLTTVGYGDISPVTPLGQILASVVMILGYSIIAVPTGIMSVEIAQAANQALSSRVCASCSGEGHDEDALYCKFCGTPLNMDQDSDS